MGRLFPILAAAAAMAASPVAASVIFQQSGTTGYLDVWGPLPGAGQYKITATSSLPIQFEMGSSYLRHWDVFLAPPPRPHDEYIEGNSHLEFFDASIGPTTNAAWSFKVPAIEYTYFDSTAYYLDFGIPIGTPLYEEVKFEDPAFFITSGAEEAFSYTVTLELISSIPEPSTWAMMITGFGLIGAALRRRPTPAVA